MSTLSALSSALTGMDSAADRFQQSASRIARAGTGLGTSPADSDGDLAADVVGEEAAHQSFKANLTVARTADEMLGTLVNIKV